MYCMVSGNSRLSIQGGLSRPKWSPATTGLAGPSMADLVAIDGPAGPSMAAMDGPLCRKLSPINFATHTSTGLLDTLNGCWFML